MKSLKDLPFEEWEPAICAAIDQKLKNGFELISGAFGSVFQNTCCALTAYDENFLYGTINEEMWAFIRGFDHFFNPRDEKSKYLNSETLRPYYILGGAIAEKYQDRITK